MPEKPKPRPPVPRREPNRDLPPSIIPDLLEQRGAAAASHAVADMNIEFRTPVADAVRKSLTRARDGGSDGEIIISANAFPDAESALDSAIEHMRPHLYGKRRRQSHGKDDKEV